MNAVFKEQLRKFVLVFFDDILLYSKDVSHHLEHLKIVLDLLRKNTLFAKFSKCSFGGSRVEYLGHIVTGAGVYTNPTKIEAIKE